MKVFTCVVGLLLLCEGTHIYICTVVFVYIYIYMCVLFLCEDFDMVQISVWFHVAVGNFTCNFEVSVT